MKNLKTALFKASLIVLGLLPIISNAQWSIPGPIGASWISTNGNVGIGTTSPQYGKLHISADVNPIGNEWTLHPIMIRGANQALAMGVNSSTYVSYIQSFKIGVSGYTLQLNPLGGNVVAGSNLYVSGLGGKFGIDNPASFSYNGNTVGTYSLGWYTDNQKPASPTAYLSSFQGIKFFTGNTVSVSINELGNVGIGTSSTTYRAKLDVNGQVVIGTNKTTATDYQLSVDGKIYCQELNVTPAGNPNWADYVFKSDYKLASLTEVEKYIKENGHLENVPSAEEVSKNGFKVGEMDATLLRKVEELTLYLLEQQKEIEALKAQIKK